MTDRYMKISRALKIITVIMFIAGVIFFVVYPLAPRHIRVNIYTNKGVVEKFVLNSEIGQPQGSAWIIETDEPLVVKEVRLFGTFRSIRLKTVYGSDFPAYIENPTGTVEGSNYIFADTGENHVAFMTNEAFAGILDHYSRDYSWDRMAAILLWGLICSIILTAIVSRDNLKSSDRTNHSFVAEVRRFVKDVKKYKEYMIYAAKSDMKAEVANSYLNRLWWLLEPLFNMLVYVIVFGTIMGSSIDHFALYVFSALIMWNYFCRTINASVQMMRNNRDVLSKVYVPKFVPLISMMILNLYKLAFSMIILVPMMIVYKIGITTGIICVVLAYILMVTFSFGLGMILLHYGVYVDDLAYAVGILLNVLMFVSGIFYDATTTLAEPINIMIIGLNPVALFTDTMRQGLMYNQYANIPLVLIWIGISLVISYAGIHIVYKNENGYAKVI